MKKTLPPIRAGKYVNDAPHVILLGAGASRAAFPDGDRNGRILPLMCELADVLELDNVLAVADVDAARRNFEAFFDAISDDPTKRGVATTIQQRLCLYFGQLELPPHASLYDRILLCLRSKDFVATFNWDPLLIQAFRRNVSVEELPKVLFLHGNVGVGVCIEHRCKGYPGQKCPHCQAPLATAPLLYPVCNKNYRADPFIANEWEELTWALRHAFIVTIIGYSAPATDEAAKALLHEAFGANTSRDFAQIEIVDIKKRDVVRSTWGNFIVRENYSVSSTSDRAIMFRHARRSCDALAWAILQQDPWHERPLPITEDLSALQEWVQPLVVEEQRYARYDAAFVPYRGVVAG